MSGRRPGRAGAGLLAVLVLTSLALRPDAGAAQSPLPFTLHQAELFSTPQAFANAWADYDGDGDPDLFVGFNANVPNRLYRNDGGRFSDVAAEARLAEARAVRSAIWGDYDGDGDPDLLLGFAPGDGFETKLYRNERGTFVDATEDAGVGIEGGATRQFAFVDVDGDSDLDLFLAFRDRPNQLLRNDGRDRFTDATAETGLGDPRRTVGAVWLDYDGDGDLDAYVGNMDGDANGLWRNDGGRFTDVAEAAGAAWAGRAPREPTNGTVRPCTGDVDGDGLLDLVAANYGPLGLLLNRGDGTFRDASASSGLAALDARWDACALADVDHDGDLDLFVNGTITGGVQYPDVILLNERGADGPRFRDATPAALGTLRTDHGVQWADADGDGDLDLALTGAEESGTHALLVNGLDPARASRSLQVTVLDGEGRATRAGALVRVYQAGTSRLLGTGIVDTGSGYDSQSVLPVHFGLAQAGPVDVEVLFPAGGRLLTARVEAVDPGEWRGRALVVRVAGEG